jgi:hypothetical protein
VALVEVTAALEAPAARAWEVAADPRNLIAWDHHIVAVHGVDADEMYEGMAYDVEVRVVPGVHFRLRALVTDVEEPRRCVIELSGVVSGKVTTTVTGMQDGRSVLEHAVEYHFHGSGGAVVERSLQLLGGPAFVLRRGVEAQKRQIERG